jgi:sugar phosphate permease
MKKQKGINDFGKQGWLIILYVLFLFWFSSAPVDLLNVSVDAFAGIKQWDGNMLLVFSSIGTWLSIVATAVVGGWVAKKGVKTPTVVCLILMGVFMILNGFVNSIPFYGIVVVLMTGISGAINLVSTNTYMSNWFPRKKGIALGWSSMGMCVSSAVSIPVFAVLLNTTHSLVPPYAVFGVIVIILGLITRARIKTMPEEAGAYPDNEYQPEIDREAALKALREYKSPWTAKKLLACPQVWLVTLCFGFLFIALMATMTQFIPRFMGAGFSQNEAMMWLTISGVLGIIGSYLWGYLDQKTTTKKTVVIYAVYMAAMQFLNAIFFTNNAVSVVLIVLIGILIGGIGNLFPSMVIQIFGRYDFASANSVCVPILTAIRAFTFIIVAAVLNTTHGDFRVLCTVLGVISVAAVVLSIFLSNKTIGRES